MSEQLQQRFGLTVRQARKRQGWSQERLAEAADLNRSYLGEIERGVVCPSLSTGAKLAAALELKLSHLLRDCEEA
ncbi:Helix-turn-helix [Solimonas aquatica]|uniref:Helix-turn-helix n=1 Tax=Solimonas aquatica TaxID=489703 RepID=A0A1H9FNR8_9GAMM|nr:helix-turn-helix transcriptional regulator [Solimonas aquatica]SEQ39525.1 Helix-turn-helix [Solimonas aquatica]